MFDDEMARRSASAPRFVSVGGETASLAFERVDGRAVLALPTLARSETYRIELTLDMGDSEKVLSWNELGLEVHVSSGRLIVGKDRADRNRN